MVEEGAARISSSRRCNTILRRRDIQTKVSGKDVLPMGGEYTAPVMVDGRRRLPRARMRPSCSATSRRRRIRRRARAIRRSRRSPKSVPPRPPGFCTGCPERPIFAAMKLVEKELGPHHVSADIGCHLFSILPPFNIGATTMGYGLGPGLGLRLQRQGRQARRSRSWATAASGTTA